MTTECTLPTQSISIDPDAILHAISEDATNAILHNNTCTNSFRTMPIADSIEISNTNENFLFRKRIKEDLFHIFQDLPLPRGCPIKADIINLLVCSMFKSCKEDYKSITKALRLKGITYFQDHFYYNKEHWRERVQMIITPCTEHDRSMKLVQVFLLQTRAQKSVMLKIKIIFFRC